MTVLSRNSPPVTNTLFPMPTYLSEQDGAHWYATCRAQGDEDMDEKSEARQDGQGENPVNEEISPSSCTSPPPIAPGMTLEQIIDLTGEFSHLNELVMIHIEKSGGFTDPEAYFRAVQPLLDLLEVEIRVRCTAGITRQQMKLVVQDWIDQEIRACTEGTGTNGT